LFRSRRDNKDDTKKLPESMVTHKQHENAIGIFTVKEKKEMLVFRDAALEVI
jgi:hypothetical protein